MPDNSVFTREMLDAVVKESRKNLVINDIFKDAIAPARFYDFAKEKFTPREMAIIRECAIEEERTIIKPDEVHIEMRLSMMSIKTFTGGTDG